MKKTAVPERPSGKPLLACGVAVFVVLHLAVLFFSTKIYPQDLEELFIGNLATDILTGGPLLPLRAYIASFRHGANLITSMLVLPFFWGVGSSFLCLKLLAIIWSTTTFILLFLAVDRYAGRKTAVIACALYLVPSSSGLFYSLWATTNHQCVLTCVLAMLLCFPAPGANSDGTAAQRRALALGYLMSFSIFLWTSNACVSLGILVYFLCRLQHIPRKGSAMPVAALLTGMLLGFIPMLPGLRETAGTIFSVGYSTRQSVLSTMRRAYQLCGPLLWASYRPWGSSCQLWEWIVYPAGIAAYLRLAWETLAKRMNPHGALGAMILLFPLIYIPFLAASGLTHFPGHREFAYPYSLYTYFHVRYAYPLANILMLAQAILIGELVSSRRRFRRAAGAALLTFFAVFEGYSLYLVMVPASEGLGLRQSGCFMQETGCQIAERTLDNWPAFESLLARAAQKDDPVLRTDIARGAAWISCLNTITRGDRADVDPGRLPIYERLVSDHVPPAFRGVFREELGAFVFHRSGFNLPLTIDTLTRGLTAREAEAGFIGIARVLPMWTKDPATLSRALDSIPLKDKDRLAHAMGRYFASLPDRGEAIAAIAGKIVWRDAFLAGCGDVYGSRMDQPPSQIH